MISHFQTVGIVGNLKVDWPPSVVALTSVMNFNMLDFSLVRPECLLVDVKGASPFFIFTIAACGLVLILLTVLNVMTLTLKFGCRCLSKSALADVVDSLEFAQSIFFSLQLVLRFFGRFFLFHVIFRVILSRVLLCALFLVILRLIL